jgi:hypothetical protein
MTAALSWAAGTIDGICMMLYEKVGSWALTLQTELDGIELDPVWLVPIDGVVKSLWRAG